MEPQRCKRCKRKIKHDHNGYGICCWNKVKPKKLKHDLLRWIE